MSVWRRSAAHRLISGLTDVTQNVTTVPSHNCTTICSDFYRLLASDRAASLSRNTTVQMRLANVARNILHEASVTTA